MLNPDRFAEKSAVRRSWCTALFLYLFQGDILKENNSENRR